MASKAASSLEDLQNDPDITKENMGGAEEQLSSLSIRGNIPLTLSGNSHVPTRETHELVNEIGGLDKIRTFTNLFYQHAFEDPHLDTFIRSHKDDHGERFASWIAEKLGGNASGNPWAAHRESRPSCPFHVPGRGTFEVTDRSSAHFAAWHSPKREPGTFGDHFQLGDCRNWMRLHFWAAREAGVFEHPRFENYYIKFIGHFMRVYERTAPAFARESARWSEDPANIEAYRAAGNRMTSVLNVSYRHALGDIPAEERAQTQWPYDEY